MAGGMTAGSQLWLEMPPISGTAPRRLLVFLHGAGSSPETFAPIAVAWQLKFPGATAVLLQGLEPRDDGADWYDPSDRNGEGSGRITRVARQVAERIGTLHEALALQGLDTVVVGFSQGATVALEIARSHPATAAIVVAYAARLSTPIRPDEQVGSTVHLIHGEFDSVVPAVYASRAYRGLRAVGADVTLDIVADETHTIGQELVSLGTTRVMQTLFRGRSPARRPTVH
jgi:phospholipase/carboxylesterase